MTKLAILGGQPVRADAAPIYNTIGAAEKRAVMEVLDSGELSGFVAGATDQFWGGKKVKALENAFKEYFNVKYAVAVNSATSGLHAALSAAGVGPGDEVITSPYTMAASATSALMCGAVPIFADVEPETFCLDPASVESRITDRTKAIVAVNIFGQAADLDALFSLAEERKLCLIEDNAQAPGARYKGRYTGTVGHAGVFSFNRHKTMQSGEGGVIITNDESLALRAAMMRNHGEVAVAGMGIADISNTVGLNYRMTEMEAAVAYEQFQKLDSLNYERIALAEKLSAGLERISGMRSPKLREGADHVYYFYPILYDQTVTGIRRDWFVKAVQAEGFMLRAGYVRPIYLEPLYQQKICFGKHGYPFTANPRNQDIHYGRGLCPIAERLQDEELLITNITYSPFTPADMELFVTACNKVLNCRDQVISHFT